MKPNSGRKGKKGQVSAELIILIAAVLSVALILVVQLQSTAKEGKKALSDNAHDVFTEINETADMATARSSPTPEKHDSGESCGQDSDCKSKNCVFGLCE